ncbi:MAG: DNA polymerase Y family protein [bacterium]|nr:DNA polymerase Y family protein [bacterium]
MPSLDPVPRIACLMVPLFPLAARLRSEPELAQEALAVLAGSGPAARVVAATRLARRAGIRPGFTLSQARVRLPKLIARPRDAECERAAREALLDVAESFSPRVEDGDEGLAYLDACGLERHYPGESPDEELGRALMLASEQRAGLPIRVGIAASKLAARVAAGQPHSPTLVPAGGEARFLAPLPLSRLTPQAKTLATLTSWGIHSLGELADLPKDEVASRLGPMGQDLHAMARGVDPEPLMPRHPPPAFAEGMELEWPLVNLEPFVFVARGALERITLRMQSQGLACERLGLSLELEPDGHHERSITLPAPTRDVKTLLTLVRLDLEAHPPGAPILAFTLNAHPDKPREAQLSLFGPAALSPDKLATTVARLFSMLGKGRVGSPRTVDAHRPERFALEPYAPPPPPKERPEARLGRGLLTVRVLRPPLEIEVITDRRGAPGSGGNGHGDHGGSSGEGSYVEATEVAEPVTEYASARAEERPISFKTLIGEEESRKPRIEGRVRVASGPWGLEEDWWSPDRLERDYWDVELTSGGLYRIYRDRGNGDWFVDGVYD